MSYTTTSLDGVIATDNIETAQQVIDAISSQGAITTGTVSVSSSVNTDKITIAGDAISSIGATTNDIKITNSVSGLVKIDNILTLKNNTIGSLTNNDVVIAPSGSGSLKTDNLQFDGNTVSATDTNGNLNLNANGSGKVIIDNDLAIDRNGFTQTANSDIYLTTTSGKVRIDSMSFDAGTVKAELGDLTLTTDDTVTNKVFIGSFPFKLNQSIGAGNNNHVLTYDNSTNSISLQAASGGGSSQWTTSGSNIYYDGGNVGVGVSSSSVNSQLMVKDTGASHTAVQVTSGAAQNCSVKLSRGAGDWSSSNNETIGLHLDTDSLLFSRLTAEGNNLTGFSGDAMRVDVLNSKVGIASYPYAPSTTLQLGSIGSARNESIKISTNAGAGIADRSIEMGVDSTSSFIESNDSANAPIELQVRQGSNGNVVVVDADGDVGIGNTTPAAKLSVACSSGKRALLITGDPGSGASQVYLSGATYGIAMGMNNSSASNYALSINNSSTSMFYLQNNGQIGIGNNSPTVGKLQITGFVAGSVPQGYYSSYNGSGGIHTVGYSASSFAYSLYCSNAIGANAIGWTSDERIKTEITVVDDAWALQKVRDIECKEYHYKDPIMRKEQKTIGFIAQDIKQHLPQAVSQITDYVPDELRPIENINWMPVDGGFKVVIPNVIWKEEHTRMMKFYVTTTEDEQEIKLELKADDNNAVIFEKQYATVYLYGKEVNNFLQIAKDKIYSLHHSAIQEIDRIQTAHKNKISTLEARMALLEQRLNNAGL